MSQSQIDMFYKVVTPYALILICILLIALLFLRLVLHVRIKWYPIFYLKATSMLFSFQKSVFYAISRMLAKLVEILPPSISKTLSPKNVKFKEFIAHHHKLISNAFSFLIFTPSAIILSRTKHPLLYLVMLFPLVFGFAQIRFNKLLQALSNNRVFSVCPNCGYVNINLVKDCKSCRHNSNDSDSTEALKTILNTEDRTASDKDIACCVPTSIINGLKLDQAEKILFSHKFGMIKKNGLVMLRNDYNIRCRFNYIVLTKERIFFVAYIFWGWLKIESFTYEKVSDYKLRNRVFPDISGLLGDYDKLTLYIDGSEYNISGFNPHNRFLEMVAIIRNSRYHKPDRTIHQTLSNM